MVYQHQLLHLLSRISLIYNADTSDSDLPRPYDP